MTPSFLQTAAAAPHIRETRGERERSRGGRRKQITKKVGVVQKKEHFDASRTHTRARVRPIRSQFLSQHMCTALHGIRRRHISVRVEMGSRPDLSGSLRARGPLKLFPSLPPPTEERTWPLSRNWVSVLPTFVAKQFFVVYFGLFQETRPRTLYT